MEKAVFRVRHGSLEQVVDGDVKHVVSLESSEWIDWLENHHRFSFESIDGKFTARKEQRSGHWYWYAYRRVGGILSTAYLGRSQSLTFGRLQTIAQTFCMPSLPPGRPSLQESHPPASSSRPELAPQDTLLLTKLQIPLLPSRLLPRPSLIERLTSDISQTLVLLSAPAGSGKTTVLSEWAAASQLPVAWVSLDDGDNDPVRFWRYLIAALETIHSGVGTHALALLRTPQTLSLEAVVIALINAITTCSQDIVLVLDDYHAIRAQTIHQTLAFFLDYMPATMHLVIASRVDPPLPLPRFRVHCRMAEWRSADLRFTPHETAAFFARTVEVELAPEMVSNLDVLTEGWVAGLQLTAISLRHTPLAQDMLRLLRSSPPHHPAIFAYLASEVWQRQPRTIQQFLLKAALVERANASLCNALTGQTNGQQMLEQIERANLFLVPLDQQHCWYRLHHLFRSFLLERLHLLPQEKVRALHRRACQWYEQHGLMTEAVHHALLSGDEGLAARLVIAAGQTMVRHHEMATVLQWLDALPAELVCSHPQLCLFRAWIQITSGQFLASGDWVQRAWQRLQGREQELSEQALLPLSGTPEELLALEGEIAMLRSHLAVFRGDISQAVADALHALTLLPEADLFLRSLGELNRGVSHWLNDETQAAVQALTRAEILGQTAGNTYVILTALCVLTHIQLGQGQLQRAYQTNHQALQLAREKRGESLWATASSYISRGQLLYLWNDLEAATRSLEEGISLSTRWHHHDMLIYGYTVMAQVKQAQGDSLAALRLVHLADQSIPVDQPHPWLVSIMVALQMQLALIQRNGEAIERWQQTQLCNYVKTFEQLALAQIALAHHESERALAILEQETERAKGCGRFGTLIDILVLQTIAYQQQHARQQAWMALEQALIMAEPEGYIRPFVNGGPLVQALVEEALVSGGRTLRGVSSPYLHRVLAACDRSPVLRAEGQTRTGQHPTTPTAREEFSPREIDILRLIMAGCSTQEIARRFVLAPTTVRWHIRNIYSKLQVHNRAQVIVRAQALGIVPQRELLQKEGEEA